MAREQIADAATQRKYAELIMHWSKQTHVDLYKERKDNSGLSWIAQDDSRVVEAPRPTTPVKLYIFLHEIMHHYYDHHSEPDVKQGGRPTHVHEYEATKKAIEVMRDNHIPITPRVWVAAAWNLEINIRRDKKKGLPINSAAERFGTESRQLAKAA